MINFFFIINVFIIMIIELHFLDKLFPTDASAAHKSLCCIKKQRFNNVLCLMIMTTISI